VPDEVKGNTPVGLVLNNIVDLINTTAPTTTPAPGSTIKTVTAVTDKNATDEPKAKDKADTAAKLATEPHDGVKIDEPTKKMYCN
jgi:hypothetical protein